MDRRNFLKGIATSPVVMVMPGLSFPREEKLDVPEEVMGLFLALSNTHGDAFLDAINSLNDFSDSIMIAGLFVGLRRLKGGGRKVELTSEQLGKLTENKVIDRAAPYLKPFYKNEYSWQKGK